MTARARIILHSGAAAILAALAVLLAFGVGLAWGAEVDSPPAGAPAADVASHDVAAGPAGLIAATPDVAPAPTIDPESPSDLIGEAYRGITAGDWFLVAGAALSLVVLGVRWLLARRWPAIESDLWGIALVAGIAGIAAVAHAWLAGADVGERTLLGALRVWAAAVFAYVTARKLIAPAKDATA